MLTQALLVALVGMLVSVLIEIIPGFKEFWAKWKWKPAALAVGFLILPLIAWALVCFTELNIPTPSTDCGINGAFEALQLGFVAFVASQGMYQVVVRKLPSVRARNGAA